MNTERKIQRLENEAQRLRDVNSELQLEINSLTREMAYKDRTIETLEGKLTQLQAAFDTVAQQGSEAIEDAAEAAMMYREQLDSLRKMKRQYQTEMEQLMFMLRREANGKAV